MRTRKKQSDQLSTQSPNVILELISYNKEAYDLYDKRPVRELVSLTKPDRVNWINLDGLEDQQIITELQSHYSLHPLLIEDVIDDQRPKAEEYDDYLFFTIKMLYKIDSGDIDYEQISFVLGENYLLSFQEKAGDFFDALRGRIKKDLGKVRKRGADYLLYRLIDIIVDQYYIILDNIGEQIEEIEETLFESSSEDTFRRIQKLKKQLIHLRKLVFPLREALNKLAKGENDFVKEENVRYFSDVYDHVIHLIDSLDAYKDLTSSLMDVHFNTQNNQLNKIIKVLTVISTIFIPLTFIVGVYGMNFKFMPELGWQFGYPMVWSIMILMSLTMLGYFKYKKWF